MLDKTGIIRRLALADARAQAELAQWSDLDGADARSFAESIHRYVLANIVGIVGLDAAISYLEASGLAQMRRHERELMGYMLERLTATEGVRILGNPETRSAIVSFELEGASSFDVAFLLDKMGIAVRSGHHCAQPALRGLGVSTCVRASLAPYNDFRDVDALSEGLMRIRTLVGA